MPERTRGRDPNRHQEKQEQLPDYRKAARFPDEPTSNTAYEQTRDIIYEAPYDLSLYRTVLMPDVAWHVLVLGQTPDETVRGRIDQVLLSGEAVELPEEVWRAFNLRRLEQSGTGPSVEKRHKIRRVR
jgi:hypothetical protein